MFSFAQEDITGIWKGTLFNDTTAQYLPYEIVISEYKGKLSGYSRTVFTEAGKDEIGIKSIKVKKRNNKVIIEDDELIYNSYSIAPPKGVRKLLVMELTVQDTVQSLKGNWATNRTKVYLPATGKVSSTKSFKRPPSALLDQLAQLKLTDKINIYSTAAPLVAKVETPVEKQAEVPNVKVKEPVVTVEKKPKKVEKKKEVTPQPEVAPTTAVVAAPVAMPPAANILARKITATQEIFFEADSLTLTLYDNGEIDGDTVSVMLNGELIYSKLGLSTKANSKTIYITPETPDSLVLIMYAENLGAIPPNTGLLVVHDGEKVYELRFSADLENNAIITLKRKRKSK